MRFISSLEQVGEGLGVRRLCLLRDVEDAHLGLVEDLAGALGPEVAHVVRVVEDLARGVDEPAELGLLGDERAKCGALTAAAHAVGELDEVVGAADDVEHSPVLRRSASCTRSPLWRAS
jgi:hypothetical protein